MSNKIKQIALGTVDTTFYQFDPQLGFWGIPNIERDVTFPQCRDALIRVRHNGEGNRDKTFVAAAPGEGILCTGGSHTWGGGVVQERRFSDVLENRTGIPVYNIGHVSMGLDQICLAIMTKSDFYTPAVIIVEQYPWAIHRILNNYVVGFVRPHFYFDASGRMNLRKVPKLARRKVVRLIMGAFYAYRKELLEYQAGINLKEGYNPRTDPIFLHWKTAYYDFMYRLVDGILAVMRDFCLQRQIHLLFALGAIAQQFGDRSPSALIDYDLPRKKLSLLLEKNRIPYVDMTDPMIYEHTPEDPVIFPDGHINIKGNEIFARTLHDKLGELGWLRS
jgi:hypothetical protein